ncbi:MAG TPA: ArsA family ATPase [Verrucomicrobiae bacterium]|nr:ArsA family ATPase [Verrucomicrobiae bacterium]
MRVILYTGKGGVGKTSIAAATAVACARRGRKTLVMSTDAAHSLGDSLDQELGDQPRQVAPGLFAQEVNALHELEHNWERIHHYLATLFNSQGIEDIIAEEMASPPGMEEVASLMWIKHHAERSDYDVLIVDCAPTGETLQLLAFPDVARWYLNKIFPIERRVMKLARPMVQPFLSIPLPSDEIFVSVRDLLTSLESMKSVLGDPSVCTVRIVLNLEKMVIKEAQRAYTYLNLYDYLTDAICVNRVLPDDVVDVYFDDWRRQQVRYAAQVRATFDPLPIFSAPLFDHEVVGVAQLGELGEALYGERDPAEILSRARPQRVRKDGSDYVLTLDLGFATKDAVSLSQRDDELYVTIGAYKRELALPRVLRGTVTSGAHIEDGQLSIRFRRQSA